MTYLTQLITLLSHLAFIAITHRLLITLFDWSKWVTVTPDSQRLLSLFLIFVSVAVGFLVSTFLLTVIQFSQLLVLGIS